MQSDPGGNNPAGMCELKPDRRKRDLQHFRSTKKPARGARTKPLIKLASFGGFYDRIVNFPDDFIEI
jgi:hypothetical protein